MRRRGLLGLAGALVAGQARAQAPGTTLRVRFNSDIRGTDPFGSRDENTDAVLLHCVEGLVAFRENTEVAPLLAERIEVGDEGRRYTFHLRNGARFHNGAALTSAEVLWTWHRLMDPATQWRGLPDFDGHGAAKITGIEAPDARTVVFTLAEPSALFLVNMARPDYGGSAILHPDSVADGKWRAPVGTGPFSMGAWVPGQSIELRRNGAYASLPGPRDGYTGGKQAAVDRVMIGIVPDNTAASAALRSGAIDVMWPVSPASYDELKSDPGVATEVTPIMNLYAILLQTQDPLLKDVRIRRAFAMALDTGAIAGAITEGLAQPNPSIVPSSSPYYSQVQRVGVPSDPAAAKRLLAQAGYAGQPIVLLANNQYPTMNDMAVLAQAMAADAGLNLKIEVLDWATQLDRYTRGQPTRRWPFCYFVAARPVAQSFETLVSGAKSALAAQGLGQPGSPWRPKLARVKHAAHRQGQTPGPVRRTAPQDDRVTCRCRWSPCSTAARSARRVSARTSVGSPDLAGRHSRASGTCRLSRRVGATHHVAARKVVGFTHPTV